MNKVITALVVSLLGITSIYASADAVVVEVKNSVSICRAKGECGEASFGNKVNTGDTIVTEAGSSSKIRYSSGTEIEVTENSRLVFGVISKEEKKVKADWGKFDFDVKKADSKSRFKVETPVAVAGTEGTKFSVSVAKESGETKLSLFSGLLKVTNLRSTGNSFLLKPNQGVRLSKENFQFNPFTLQKATDKGSSHQLKKSKSKTTGHMVGAKTKNHNVDNDVNNGEETDKTEVIIEIK